MALGRLAALALATGLFGARCDEAAPRAQATPPSAPAAAAASCEDAWLAAHQLNELGDPPGTMYTGGTPLFDERTGQRKDRREYLLAKLPALKAACAASDAGG